MRVLPRRRAFPFQAEGFHRARGLRGVAPNPLIVTLKGPVWGDIWQGQGRRFSWHTVPTLPKPRARSDPTLFIVISFVEGVGHPCIIPPPFYNIVGVILLFDPNPIIPPFKTNKHPFLIFLFHYNVPDPLTSALSLVGLWGEVKFLCHSGIKGAEWAEDIVGCLSTPLSPIPHIAPLL